MAVDRTPVLKRCRSLGIEPAVMGLDKKSNRNVRAGRKLSEYGVQLKEKQKAKAMLADIAAERARQEALKQTA